jgi:hypothetical protein
VRLDYPATAATAKKDDAPATGQAAKEKLAGSMSFSTLGADPSRLLLMLVAGVSNPVLCILLTFSILYDFVMTTDRHS